MGSIFPPHPPISADPTRGKNVNIKRQFHPPPTFIKTFFHRTPTTPSSFLRLGQISIDIGILLTTYSNCVLRHFLSFCLCEMVLLVLHRKRSRFQSRLTYSPSRMSQDNSTLISNLVSLTPNATLATNNTDLMLYTPQNAVIVTSCADKFG